MIQFFHRAVFLALGVILMGACSKAPEPVLAKEQGRDPLETIEFAFVPACSGLDTKAVKTAWEDGDVVFVFFNGITGSSAAPKYLKLSYVASSGSWTYTQMGGLTATDLIIASDKRLTAVYLPFANNATVSLDGGSYGSPAAFRFEPSPMSLYWHSENTSYTISHAATSLNKYTIDLPQAGTVLPLSVPEGFIQFFLADDSAGSDPNANVRIREASLKPSGVSKISTDGLVIPFSEEEGSRSGMVLRGYPYSKGNEKGWLFSGILPVDRWNSARDYSLYLMGVGRNRMLELKKSKTMYTGSAQGRAWKLPALSNWTENPSALPGIFSVGYRKQAFFSAGNLRVNASTTPRQWAIETNQWGFNTSNSLNPAYISHFSYGSGNNPTGEGASRSADYVEWGIHFDSAGTGSDATTNGSSWYTPFSEEWFSVFNHRDKDNKLKGRAQIYIAQESRTVDGLVLLPDDWVLPAGCTFVPNSASGDNRYTTGTDASGYSGRWSAMEAAGAVFLPAAGIRNGSSISEAGTTGYYWSSVFIEEGSAMCARIRWSSNRLNTTALETYYTSGACVRFLGPDPTQDLSTWPGSGE